MRAMLMMAMTQNTPLTNRNNNTIINKNNFPKTVMQSSSANWMKKSIIFGSRRISYRTNSILNMLIVGWCIVHGYMKNTFISRFYGKCVEYIWKILLLEGNTSSSRIHFHWIFIYGCKWMVVSQPILNLILKTLQALR